jgi:DNA-binding response OmpR family regulator
MIKILYGEDQIEMAEIVKDCLEHSGFDIDYCTDGKQVLSRYKLSRPDMIILDIMMPELDGFDVALQIREHDHTTPIIFVTARTQTTDVLKGFELGANDYLRKPYSVEELIARIRSLLKSNYRPQPKEHPIGIYTFNVRNKLLYVGDQQKKMSYRESELLRILSENRNQVIKRKDILDHLWENDGFFTGRSLDVFISRLRTYLNKDRNIRIVNVRKAGYMLVAPDTSSSSP